MEKFTQKDLADLQNRGISTDVAQQQIHNFINGFPFLKVTAPATVGNGIVRLSESEQNEYIQTYELYEGSVLKFVPASGAASRMFKALFEAIDDLEAGKTQLTDQAEYFFKNLNKFAFYNELKTCLDQNNITESNRAGVLKTLLGEKGLNYGGNPKGLLSFHKYDSFTRTAFEEHLVEGALYAKEKDGSVKLHFTVSPEHVEGFMQLLKKVQADYEQKFGVKYYIVFSQQRKSTDTLAVNLDNTPFRDPDESILFRPAGHGALLNNLNVCDADIIFIKNIDNVVHQDYIDETAHWKKVLSGLAVELKVKINCFLSSIDKEQADSKTLAEAAAFIGKNFNIKVEPIKESIYKILNRPLRVCGIVKNEGEPGGGPFFAPDACGNISLQIAESSQIDMKDPKQKSILESSTHFNPVDLICSIKDHKGNKFDLFNFRDASTGFISEKTKDGKPLKAQELPGLWNGAMSDWSTVFVETPVSVFNPVKTVNDLLKKEHNKK